MAQSFGRTKVLRIQTIPKISKNRGFQSRGKQRSAVHNLDPGSYQNPRKRALEEARGFGQIFIIDSLPSSLGKNGDDKTLGKLLLQQRKRQFAGGGNEDPEHFGWAAESHDQTQTQTQSMPYDDFRSLVAQRCESSSLSFHTKTDTAKNASELAGRMVEKESQKPPRGRQPGANPRPPPPPMGEIVEVEGGHIVRSTGRKDRHSKVYTAKGPRDRRVRLSAATAIQFYDLQDRLGYDRPSKAVAWLIDKAKASIDELAKLPKTRIPTNEPKPAENDKEREPVDESPNEAQSSAAAAAAATSIKADHSRAIARERARERAKERTQERDAVAKAVLQDNRSSTVANSVPPSYLNLFSNANIQSLQLPNAASKGFTAGQSPHTFHPAAQMNISPDSFSRSLNLQASQLYQSLLAVPNFSTAASQFDSPTAVFSEADNSNIGRNQTHQQSQFSSSAPSAFQAPFTAMPEQQNQQHHEFAGSQQPQRISRHSWNSNGISISNAAADNCAAYSAPNIRGQCQQHNSFTFRGTLQSSSSPIRVRPMPFTLDYAAGDPILQNPATSSGSGEYSGYRYPARIQGIDEHDDVKPSAASSNSQL